MEGPVYRVPVLQDWLPWLIAWRRKTSCCGCFVYLYKLLLSMPFLQCQLNCCRRISLKPGKGSNWASFVKVPRNFAISALPSPLQFPVLVTLEILMWILYYFSAIRKKYFGKVHRFIWWKNLDLHLFQFGVNPYFKFLEFPVGNTIFQPALLQTVRQGSLAAEHIQASVSPSFSFPLDKLKFASTVIRRPTYFKQTIDFQVL